MVVIYISLLLKQCSLLRRSLSYSRLYPQFKYMTFIYSHSFIHHFTGLFGTKIMTSSQLQLACQLRWQSTAPVSQKPWVQIPYRPEFFFRPYFHDCSRSVYYCEDRFHIHIFCSIETSPEIGSRDSADMHNVQLQKGIPTICWLESARTQDPLRRYGTGDEATDSFTMAVILIWKVLLSAFSDSSG